MVHVQYVSFGEGALELHGPSLNASCPAAAVLVGLVRTYFEHRAVPPSTHIATAVAADDSEWIEVTIERVVV